MYYRRKVLLALIEKSDNKRIGKLNLQKLLFLFCQKQDKQIYDFIPYHYGCFSFQANKDLTLLSSFYNLVKNDKKEWKLITNDNYFDQLKNTDATLLRELLKTEEIDNPSKLISRIYRKYPYYAIKSKRDLSSDERQLINKEREKIKSNKDSVLFTIGYEGISLDAYLNKLVKNNISLLCDVRKKPLSMKYGFSKKQLQNYCNNLGIRYVHIPNLGIENYLRKDLTDKESYKKLFTSYKIGLNKKTAEIIRVHELLKKYKRIALTCFEKDHTFCHRESLSIRINNDYNIPVSHL